MEQIRAMLEAMHKDSAFVKEMMELMKAGDTGEIVRLAEKKGFVFSEADWQAYIDMRKVQFENAGREELSPQDLEKVGGGATQNRYDPKDCSNIHKPTARCNGGSLFDGYWGIWCDHYREIWVVVNGGETHAVCGMGRFDGVFQKYSKFPT